MSAAKNLIPFEVTTSEGYSTLKLCGDMSAETAKEFEKVAPDLIERKLHLVVNCEEVSALHPNWARALLQLGKSLKQLNKETSYILLSEKVQKDLKTQGLDTAFKLSANLRTALVEMGVLQPKALDVNFINPFLAGTMNVLKVQAQTESKPGAPYKRQVGEKFLGDISGIIGLVSEAFSGSVVISFPADTFLKIMSRMLGEEFKEINKDMEDGAGELTNIIFGQAKVTLNERGYGIKTALPSVISGKDHSVQNISRGPRMAIPFESDAGPFVIEICLTE